MESPVVTKPFLVNVEQGAIDRIRDRLACAHWANAPADDVDWVYGTDVAWLRGLVQYWISSYDWRAAERELNRWPQYRAVIDGLEIHFYHVKGSSTRSRPLLLTHGWPGSVLEFQGCIEQLAFPARHGGAEHEGFDLVIPSLPGYGFSGRPARPMGPRAVAQVWRRLMVDVLGYREFVAQGGDWGAAVTSWLGIDHADVTRGIHLNMLPSWVFSPPDQPSAEEQAYHARVAKVRASELGYFAIQSTKPQTVALALADSPLGFAAWVCEKFRSWGDTHGDIDSRFSRDTLITNLMLYLLNDAVGSSIWMYRGRAEESPVGAQFPRVEVPTGVACFPAEFIPYPPRAVAERAYAIERWTQMNAGGHFAALEEPQAFSEELRAYCSQIGF
jgi:microsomal epoxide hydrolase